jgi:hypothetical protein
MSWRERWDQRMPQALVKIEREHAFRKRLQQDLKLCKVHDGRIIAGIITHFAQSG